MAGELGTPVHRADRNAVEAQKKEGFAAATEKPLKNHIDGAAYGTHDTAGTAPDRSSMGSMMAKKGRYVAARLRYTPSIGRNKGKPDVRLTNTQIRVMLYACQQVRDPVKDEHPSGYFQRNGKHQRACHYYVSREKAIYDLWGVSEEGSGYKGRWQALQRALDALVDAGAILRCVKSAKGRQTEYDLTPIVRQYVELSELEDNRRIANDSLKHPQDPVQH